MEYFKEIVTLQKKGIARGICSVCSAHELVVASAMRQALRDGVHVLIESTSNQVNQFGGYTGMKPAAFREFVLEIAEELGFPRERVILGGDHLGPGPFQNEDAGAAMAKAREMVESYVSAGFTKIHLDASMPLGGDPDKERGIIDPGIAAKRCAELCLASERAWGKTAGEPDAAGNLPLYVIGTEVPIPGGSDEVEEGIKVTSVSDLQNTISLTKDAFFRLGLVDAWERVVAVVAQPGVEFGDRTIIEYDREKAAALSRAGKRCGGIVFEAHSTDYQTASRMKQMVEDGFAILKVGPALTFAMREAIFALGMMEQELAAKGAISAVSGIFSSLEGAMNRNPKHWERYYSGPHHESAFARKFSFFDRIRYYWPDTGVKNALEALFANLRGCSVPMSLVSQFMPVQYKKVREGALALDPKELVMDHVMELLSEYSYAAGLPL